MKESAVRRTMRANKSKNTSPELLLRRELWKAGLRGYRLHTKNLPGKPDVAWIGRKVAVFLNGCFWHACPLCTAKGRTPIPKTNTEYWTAKRQGNMERQEAQIAALTAMGWKVVVVWECALKRDPAEAIDSIREALS